MAKHWGSTATSMISGVGYTIFGVGIMLAKEGSVMPAIIAIPAGLMFGVGGSYLSAKTRSKETIKNVGGFPLFGENQPLTEPKFDKEAVKDELTAFNCLPV